MGLWFWRSEEASSEIKFIRWRKGAKLDFWGGTGLKSGSFIIVVRGFMPPPPPRNVLAASSREARMFPLV